MHSSVLKHRRQTYVVPRQTKILGIIPAYTHNARFQNRHDPRYQAKTLAGYKASCVDESITYVASAESVFAGK
jgi:hypothetical protein